VGRSDKIKDKMCSGSGWGLQIQVDLVLGFTDPDFRILKLVGLMLRMEDPNTDCTSNLTLDRTTEAIPVSLPDNQSKSSGTEDHKIGELKAQWGIGSPIGTNQPWYPTNLCPCPLPKRSHRSSKSCLQP
jgi:hypothetical protein